MEGSPVLEDPQRTTHAHVTPLLSSPLLSSPLSAYLPIGETVPYFSESPHPYIQASGVPEIVWSDTIQHTGAVGLWVHFQQLDLAPGDWVVVRDPASVLEHAYTGTGPHGLGTFWAEDVPGDTAVVELLSSGGPPGFGLVIETYGWRYPEPPGDEEPTGSSEAPRRPDQRFGRNRTERATCGPTFDLEDVVCRAANEPVAYDRAMAVARVTVFGGQIGACTGFLVSCQDHLITNQHCIPEEGLPEDAHYEFDVEWSTCRSSNDLMDCAKGEAQGVTFFGGTLIRAGGILPGTDDLDYSLIRVNGNPSLTYPWLHLERSDDIPPDPLGRPSPIPQIGDRIYMPNHTAECAKQFGLDAPFEAGGVCRIVDTVLPCLESFPFFQDDYAYNCDQDQGASGSPVLSYLSNRVIAVNNCEGPDDSCPNQGVSSYRIVSQSGIDNDLPPLPEEVPRDSVVLTRVGDPFRIDLRFEWESAANAASYRIQRGTLSNLHTGFYDHHVDQASGAGWCAEPGEFHVFTGQAGWTGGAGDYYYIVTGLNPCSAEGTAGVSHDAELGQTAERPAGYGCD